MAIVLRDLVLDDNWTNSSSNSRSTFDDIFSSTALELKTCATTGEVFCDMLHNDFRPLSALPKFKRDTYLPQLQEQWFVVFDRLAKLQYDVEPKKHFADYHVPDVCTMNLAHISAWPVGIQDLLLESKASTPSSPKVLAKAQRKVLPKAAVNVTNVLTQTPDKEVTIIDVSGSVNKKAAVASVDISKSMLDKRTAGSSVQPSGSVDKKVAATIVEATGLNADMLADASANVTQSQTLAAEATAFQPMQLVVPLKRKTDAVENMAEALLKKIRSKDPVDADKLEKARVFLPDPSPKFCSQSKALCEQLGLAKEFGGTGLPPPPIMKRSDYEAEIEE